jgi:4-hydroxy-3-polyprenylbenzoate decarboxylase
MNSKELCQKIGDLIFASKAGFGVAKAVVLENDIDVTNVEELCWAFASRAQPEHGEIYFPQRAQNALPVFLDPDEKHTFKAMKIIHNALLADRFELGSRPLKSDFQRGWPPETQKLVLERWVEYGFQDGGR